MKKKDYFELDVLVGDDVEKIYIMEHCYNCPLKELVITNDDSGNIIDGFYYCRKFELDCISCRELCLGAPGSQLSLFDFS